MGWLGGPEAMFVETLDENEVGEECAKTIRAFTGDEIPLPEKVVV